MISKVYTLEKNIYASYEHPVVIMVNAHSELLVHIAACQRSILLQPGTKLLIAAANEETLEFEIRQMSYKCNPFMIERDEDGQNCIGYTGPKHSIKDFDLIPSLGSSSTQFVIPASTRFGMFSLRSSQVDIIEQKIKQGQFEAYCLSETDLRHNNQLIKVYDVDFKNFSVTPYFWNDKFVIFPDFYSVAEIIKIAEGELNRVTTNEEKDALKKISQYALQKSKDCPIVLQRKSLSCSVNQIVHVEGNNSVIMGDLIMGSNSMVGQTITAESLVANKTPVIYREQALSHLPLSLDPSVF